MRTIDGVQYISAKEYADMMNLTAGRVSQLKSELPFVKFEEFGIELINFDLLSITQADKALSQAKFQTTTPIHTLSYKDLGNYFGNFVMDLVTFRGSADVLIGELQAKNTELLQELEACEAEKHILSKQVINIEAHVKHVTEAFHMQVSENAALNEEFEKSNIVNEELNLQFDTLSAEYQNLRTISNEGKHQLEIKIVENKNLASENENLKARLAQMGLSAKNELDFRQEFNEFKTLMMQKIK